MAKDANVIPPINRIPDGEISPNEILRGRVSNNPITAERSNVKVSQGGIVTNPKQPQFGMARNVSHAVTPENTKKQSKVVKKRRRDKPPVASQIPNRSSIWINIVWNIGLRVWLEGK
ncbi:MAG TPA: hypothetical protein VKJ65_07325 [Phycisphaerae bacterium]|nr:hypothetical protein [Phycisphaerae bacterium]